MPSIKPTTIALVLATTLPAPLQAADFVCEALVPIGQKIVCAGFEPNWAVELACAGEDLTATFIDAFSGTSIVRTPGSVAIVDWDPWIFTTSNGVRGKIAMTPAGCTDESDAVRDFTFTPSAAPGLPGPFRSFCCRLE
jgi:hypothetical protein